jgi:hypothetical protein
MQVLKVGLLSLCFISSLAACAPKAGPEQKLLIGKWTHKKLEQFSGGKSVVATEGKGDTFMEFAPDGTWKMTSPSNNNGGSYKWLDRKSIETTTTTSALAPQVGWRSVKQIEVTAQSLTMTTRYDNVTTGQLNQDAQPAARNTVVISVFERATP